MCIRDSYLTLIHSLVTPQTGKQLQNTNKYSRQVASARRKLIRLERGETIIQEIRLKSICGTFSTQFLITRQENS